MKQRDMGPTGFHRSRAKSKTGEPDCRTPMPGAHTGGLRRSRLLVRLIPYKVIVTKREAVESWLSGEREVRES